MKLLLSDIEAVATERPPGFIAAVMSAGVVVGSELDIDEAELRRLQRHYGTPELPPGDCPGCGR